MYGNNNNSNRQSNRSSLSSSAAKFKETNANWKLRPQIVMDGSLDSASSNQKDNTSSLVEGSLVVNEVLGVKDLKMIVKSLDDNYDCISNMVKQVCDKSPIDDGEDHGSSIKPFDICPKKVHAGIKLKKPLHVINKEKRNQKNRRKSFDLLRSGMVLLKNYISIEDQISIVKTCRDLGVGDGGFYQPVHGGRAKLHLKMMCLGKNWDCESKLYSDTRPFDDAKPPGIPDMFHDMVKKAIQDSNAHIKNVNPPAYAREIIPSMSPDICIINFYSKSGKLGLHQDKNESENSLKKGLPVVSFSIGDSAEFLYGDTRDINKADKVILESGDALIFGGKSRLVFHGVPCIHPDTAPSLLQEATDMCPGRLNLTFRQFESPVDDGEDHGSSIKPFDICPKKVHAGIKLKKPLHLINKEKRNQKNRGKSIDLLRSGMVLLKNYISIEDQISIVKTCRDLGVGDGGFYQPGYSGGTKLHLKMMCLGKNWDPESKLYSDTRPFDNAKSPGIPDMFHDMVKKAIQDSNAHIKNVNPPAYAREIIPSMSPDLCIVNFYSKSGKFGLHQDKDESEKSLKKGLPVVSFSIGDSAEFLYGDTRDIDKADKVILESGDVLIFGGKSRHVFHGVPSIHPDTAPASLQEATDMRPGRLNLTFRQY